MNIENYILPENDDSCLEAAIQASLKLQDEQKENINYFEKALLDSAYSQIDYSLCHHLVSKRSVVATFYINNQLCKFIIDTGFSKVSFIKEETCKNAGIIFDKNVLNNSLLPYYDLNEDVIGFVPIGFAPHIELNINTELKYTDITTSLYVVSNEINLPNDICGLLNIRFLNTYDVEISFKKKIMTILDKYSVDIEILENWN